MSSKKSLSVSSESFDDKECPELEDIFFKRFRTETKEKRVIELQREMHSIMNVRAYFSC